jgi:hypothetical protein
MSGFTPPVQDMTTGMGPFDMTALTNVLQALNQILSDNTRVLAAEIASLPSEVPYIVNLDALRAL